MNGEPLTKLLLHGAKQRGGPLALNIAVTGRLVALITMDSR